MPTIKSESKRLDETKNCDYHRVKIKEILGQLNKSVEENIRLSEQNTKLLTKKRFLKDRLEVTTRKLQEVMVLAPIAAEKNNQETPSPSPRKNPVAFRLGEPGSPSKFGRVSGLSGYVSNLTNEDQVSQGN
jgi:hypothetical protein